MLNKILLGALLVSLILLPFRTGDSIFIEGVTNDVKVGKLAGNRNVAFGVKNVLEEFLQDKGYDIDPNAPYKVHYLFRCFNY